MKKTIFIFFFLFSIISTAQNQVNDSINYCKRNTVLIGQGILTATAMIGLYDLWYKDFEQSSFHFKDDSQHWLQMDKAGHLHSAYHLTRLSADLMAWSGTTKKTQLIYGALYAQTFLTTVEIFDAFSKNWGFSLTDFGANLLGTGLYVSQELIWQEQRIIPKYSFMQSEFARNRPDVLGNNLSQQLLKDYNGQTYWLSLNLKSFLKQDKIPAFLNIAIGYGAENMLTATKNNFGTEQRYRQFYLSFDIDLQRIPTNKQWLKTIFSLLNVIKVPFPTLELSTNNVVKWHWIYF